MEKRKPAKRPKAAPGTKPAGLWWGPLFTVGAFFIFMAVFAAVLCRRDVPPESLPPAVTMLGAAACLLGGMAAACRAGSQGLLRGFLSGAALLLFMVALGLFYGESSFTLLTAARLGLYLLFGGAGGYLGILQAEKKRKLRAS